MTKTLTPLSGGEILKLNNLLNAYKEMPPFLGLSKAVALACLANECVRNIERLLSMLTPVEACTTCEHEHKLCGPPPCNYTPKKPTEAEVQEAVIVGNVYGDPGIVRRETPAEAAADLASRIRTSLAGWTDAEIVAVFSEPACARAVLSVHASTLETLLAALEQAQGEVERKFKMMHNLNTIQALVDGISSEEQKARAESGQYTLGKMIDHLSTLTADKLVFCLGELMSYRGYYCDLSFELTTTGETADSILKRCQSAMGEIFTGYKGGDFMMGRNTPLWVALYGHCGTKLMGIDEDGYPVTQPDD